MNRTIFLTGIVFGVLAIMLGAFGAHGLKNQIDAKALNTFETGVTYQMYHALVLLILGSITILPETKKKLIYYMIVFGVLFFSFSIYLLAINSLISFDFKSIAFLTPLGGLLLISAWIVMGYRTYRHFN